ncbi:MAG TPA: hypothetical protein VG204_16895 [Terriglobia bacterium]|nr:hypothetical protein [Terriglobia bacterium]
MPTATVFSNGTSWEHVQEVFEEERTHGVTGVAPEQYAGSIMTVWDQQIGSLLNEVLLKWVKRLMKEQSSWPDFEEFEYEPEEIPPASQAKVAAVRAARYSAPEAFVVYTIEELRQFF